MLRITRRDEGALAETYARHGAVAVALARRVLGDSARAEEVVQELFLRLWREPERYDPERGSLRSFLLAQAHGRSVDLLRSDVARRGREEREARFAVAESPSPEGDVLEATEADAVRRSLGALPEGERRAIEMAYFGGYTYREVARLLGQPEGTVKSRIRNGLLRLRSTLAEAGITSA